MFGRYLVFIVLIGSIVDGLLMKMSGNPLQALFGGKKSSKGSSQQHKKE